MASNTQWTAANQRKLCLARNCILKGIWSATSKMRCVEVLITAFFDPTRIDPMFAAIYRTFTHARLLLFKRTSRYDPFYEMLSHAKAGVDKSQGPMSGLLRAASAIGIRITINNNIITMHTPLGYAITMTEPSKAYSNNTIRQTIRDAILHHLQSRTTNSHKGKTGYRKDMVGITRNADLEATSSNF